MRLVVAAVGMRAGDREHIVRHIGLVDPVLLLPEPDNAHDPNAIALYTAPGPALADAVYRPEAEAWDLSPDDRRLLRDRQAGYVPAPVAARLRLPEDGLVGIVDRVRYIPETSDPIGFDVAVHVPGLLPRPRETRYRPEIGDGYGYGDYS